MKAKSKILVTGASGFLGSHICEIINDAGYVVHAVVRSASSRDWLDHSWLTLHEGEFSDRAFVSSILEGFEAVIHSAAELVGASTEALYSINVEATRILAEESIKAGVKKFVFISSRDAGGVNKTAVPKSESDPDTPYTPYGKSKKMAEEELAKLKDKINVISLRPVLIYGPRDRHLLRLFELIKKMSLVPIVGIKPVYMPLIFVRDVAGAALAALRARLPSGSSFYISDGSPHTMESLYRQAASFLGKKLRMIRIPARLASFIVAALYGARTREVAVTPQAVLEMRHRYRLVSTEKARRELLWEPVTRLELGIPLTLEWYKKEGWL
jgi:nucleoside-diphosphate-sugar epimerase